jgi:hypothetical protein
MLLERLLHIAQNKQLLPDHQFGFRQGHSTIHQNHRMVHAINAALESKQYCSAAFLDLSQAFNSMAYWAPTQIMTFTPPQLLPHT